MTNAVDSWSKEMFAQAVCKLLRESRRRQKLTQAQVASRTGGLISKAALANYETGHRSLRIDVLWVIAHALGENMSTIVAAAERGLAKGHDTEAGVPVTIDLISLRGSQDPRLAAVRRWVELQNRTHGGSQSGVIVLDQGAVDAMSSLIGVSPSICRSVLSTVSGSRRLPEPEDLDDLDGTDLVDEEDDETAEPHGVPAQRRSELSLT